MDNYKIESKEDVVFNILNFIFLSIALFLVLYPLYFILIASISAPEAVQQGKTFLFPSGFTLNGYAKILDHDNIWIGYKNTIIYTVLGTFINVFFTLPAAYALSRKDFLGRNIIMFLITFTMFFNGGLIPTYLVVHKMGMINTLLAMVIPNAIAVWNLIVSRTFFASSIPHELLEASRIDGCSNFKFFVSIVVPLSNALIAIMVLFYGVAHWNSYFNALIFLRSEEKYSLQLILRTILIQSQVDLEMLNENDFQEQERIAELIKYGVIILSSVPLLIAYPFLQKYFVKGVMIGSIKG